MPSSIYQIFDSNQDSTLPGYTHYNAGSNTINDLPKYETLDKTKFTYDVEKQESVEEEKISPFYIKSTGQSTEPITTEWLTVDDDEPETKAKTSTFTEDANAKEKTIDETKLEN